MSTDLRFVVQNIGDRDEMTDDAVVAAVHDQLSAGLDVITDGEQTRLDFNLSFYGFLEGIELEGATPRRFGAGYWCVTGVCTSFDFGLD